MEEAFQTSVISGRTIPTGSAIGVVVPLATGARPFTATSTVAPGLPALRITASVHGARLISDGTMRVASSFIATTYLVVLMTTPELPTATITATSKIPTAAMTAKGGEYLPPEPGTSEQAQYVGRAEHRQDGNHIHRLPDHVRHL